MASRNYMAWAWQHRPLGGVSNAWDPVLSHHATPEAALWAAPKADEYHSGDVIVLPVGVMPHESYRARDKAAGFRLAAKHDMPSNESASLPNPNLLRLGAAAIPLGLIAFGLFERSK